MGRKDTVLPKEEMKHLRKQIRYRQQREQGNRSKYGEWRKRQQGSEGAEQGRKEIKEAGKGKSENRRSSHSQLWEEGDTR